MSANEAGGTGRTSIVFGARASWAPAPVLDALLTWKLEYLDGWRSAAREVARGGTLALSTATKPAAWTSGYRAGYAAAEGR